MKISRYINNAKSLLIVIFISLPLNVAAQSFIAASSQQQHYFNVACGDGYLDEVVRLVNLLREERGVGPLSIDARLMRSAYLRVYQNAAAQRLSHDGWQESFTRVHFSRNAIGENLANGFKSPKQVVKGWMDSVEHRNNMLSKKYKYVGIGCVQSSSGKMWWSQHLGG